MPIQALTIGPVHTLLVGQVYSLPTRRCKFYAVNATTTPIELSNDGINWDNASGITPGLEMDCSARFIRTVSESITIRLISYTEAGH